MEGVSSNIEQEIALLEKEIKEKRSALERERGIVLEGKDLVRSVVSEKVYGQVAPAATPLPASVTQRTSSKTYLDDLDPESVEKVNELISLAGQKGITHAIETAKQSGPFILDAFHDALVDKLHDELKNRGIIK